MHPTRSPWTSARSGRRAVQSVPACPAPACGRSACEPAASLARRADGSASGSSDILPGSAAGAVEGSRGDAAHAGAPECGAAQRRRRRDGCDSASMSGRRPSPHTPAARSPRAPRTREPRPVAEQRASPLSGIDVLQNGDIQHRLGEQLLQLAVLVFERPQTSGIRHVETAVPPLPLIERRARDPVLAAHIRCRAPRFLLAQDADDLLFAEPATLHRPSPLWTDGLYPNLEEFAGLRSGSRVSGHDQRLEGGYHCYPVGGVREAEGRGRGARGRDDLVFGGDALADTVVRLDLTHGVAVSCRPCLTRGIAPPQAEV